MKIQSEYVQFYATTSKNTLQTNKSKQLTHNSDSNTSFLSFTSCVHRYTGVKTTVSDFSVKSARAAVS